MPNFGYHLARARGNAARAVYAAMLPVIVRRRIAPARALPFEVFSYSGESSLPEQVASIRSFLRFAGRPSRFTIVSDGTHSARGLELLHAIDNVVRVARSDEWVPADIPEKLWQYLTTHSTGKQLALIMSLPASGPALYVDSDVLFFRGAGQLETLVKERDTPAFYLGDCKLSGDERLLRNEAERNAPVNTGVLLLYRKLDWSIAVARFLELDNEPTFFTNQTMTHLVMHANGAAPFDPRKYILQLDDQFEFPDRYASDSIVLRHYVNPVRHKLWTQL